MIDRESLLAPVVQLPSARPRLAGIAATARARLAEALERLDVTERDWLATAPLDRGLEAASAFRPLADFNARPPAFIELEQWVAAAGGDAWKLSYSRLLLLALIARLPAQTLSLRVPSLLWEQIEDGLAPFVEELPALGATDWSDGDFLKDLAVAQLRMLPNEGIALTGLRLHPWYVTARASVRERLAVLRYLGPQTFRKGLYVTGHSWRGFKEGRDRPQWRRASRQVALVAANPEVPAYFRAGWNDDPVLAKISPFVHQRSQLYLALGGRRFRMNSSPEIVAMATMTSRTRRRLYEEGAYVPTTYGIFVKRADFLRWADAQQEEGDAPPPGQTGD